MDWNCESGDPMNHYLFALPVEGKPRDKVFDPFKSTLLSLRWNFSLRPFPPPSEKQSPSFITRDIEGDATIFDPPRISQNASPISPTFNFGAHDLAWILRFWSLNYIPPHKLRMLMHRVSPNSPHRGRSLLHQAILCGNVEALKILLEYGPDVELPVKTTNQTKFHPIHMASRLGLPTIVQCLIDFGCDLNSTIDSGDTALMICAKYNQKKCLKVLTSAGADFGLAKYADEPSIMRWLTRKRREPEEHSLGKKVNNRKDKSMESTSKTNLHSAMPPNMATYSRMSHLMDQSQRILYDEIEAETMQKSVLCNL